MPYIDLTDTRFNDDVIRHLQRGREGLQVLPTGGVRALMLDQKFQPLGIRVMRDLRVGSDRSSFDAFVDSARGRVDGKRRFTGRLLRVGVEVHSRESGISEESLVVIMEESLV
tara:strand:- start:254 stop:592 length:339 start_codon:yes stop_codon:yes gene_type:complete